MISVPVYPAELFCTKNGRDQGLIDPEYILPWPAYISHSFKEAAPPSGERRVYGQPGLPKRPYAHQYACFIFTITFASRPILIIFSLLHSRMNCRKAGIKYATSLKVCCRMGSHSVKPNTHRRRRRDETVLSRLVGVGGVYMNSQTAHDDCRRIRRCERSRWP